MEDTKVNQRINNIVNDQVRKLESLFPAAVKDGEVDFDALREELGEFKEVDSEKYELTWAGKKNAKRLAQEDVVGRTLKFIPNDSKDADTTENLYIEGDNLEVLKLLRQNYYGAIKMIYIDPPYNTGNDFVYNDSFVMSDTMSKIADGVLGENGERYSVNKSSGNRFHANWLSMLFPRLLIAKDLLTEEGVIFISIDDGEQANLKKICDEALGEGNFVAQLAWEKKKKGAFLSKNYISMKEYILVYAKNNLAFSGLIGEITSEEGTYPCIKTTNARGIRTIRKGTPSKYREANYSIKEGTRVSSGNMELIYLNDAVVKDGILENDVQIDSNWIYGQEALDGFAKKGLIYITQDNYIRRVVNDERVKMLKDLLLRVGSDGNSLPMYVYDTNMNNGGWGTNEDANDELHQLLGEQYIFEFSKPTRLIGKLIQSVSSDDDIILDFFSGSSASADAVMQINANDLKRRKFIMVQYPEKTAMESYAIKAGYKNICEIGKERIRRAGDKIRSEHPDAENLDVGFKVFRASDTNIKWNSLMDAGQLDMTQIEYNPDLVDFMLGANDIDIVYELMLRQRNVALSESLELLSDIGERTYLYASSFLVCLETEIAEELIRKLAELDPLPIKFIFRDSAFKDDIALKDETFRRLKALVEKNAGISKPTYTVEFI